MSEETSFKDGDIVWVKLGNNWWPGEVISNEDRLPEGFNQLKRKPFCVVKFFQEDAYEYPKNAKQIYPFQCNKKDEFIKKGLALFNAKNAFMEKFPDDVKYAENQTKLQTLRTLLPFINDRSDSIVKAVLSDGRLRKSTDYYESGQADISGGRNSREQSVLRRDSATNITIMSTSNRASFGSITSISTPSGSSGTSTNANSACQYRCNLCDFSTMRQNVLIMHRKSHSSGGVGGTAQVKSILSLVKPQTNDSIIVSSSKSGNAKLIETTAMTVGNIKSPLTTKQNETKSKVIEESNTELVIPKRTRNKVSVSPNSVSKRTTRSTPPSESEMIEQEPPHVNNEEPFEAENPKHTEKIRERLLADWSDEEKDEADHFAKSALKATISSPERESNEKLQLPTTSSKSQSRRRTPTIVPMTALEGAGQTLVVGAISQATENTTKPPRIRNIPKKDRLRDFEKSVDGEVITEIKPITKESSDAGEALTPTSTVLVSLIKSAEKQKTCARSKPEVSAQDATVAAAGALSCFDFQDEEEEENECDVLKSIAKFKKKYYSPEKEKQKSTEGGEQKTSTTQRDKELSAEIDNLLEATSVSSTELKSELLQVKGLPIKERGKRIFKSRNRSRLDVDDDDVAQSTSLKQAQISQETLPESAIPINERKLRGRSTPQTIARASPLNGKFAENVAAQLSIDVSTEPTTTTTTATPPPTKRRNRKTHNNRIMQQLVDEEEASIPFIRHSPVELYSCDVAADVGATFVRERGRRSETSTPISLITSREEIVNGNIGVGVAGGSRASSRNLIAPPLTPTDETSSFGISEAGAEFGSPASSLDEERLLTPLETPNESEYGNDSENGSYNKISKRVKVGTTLPEDDDEIESPQHEALSGNERDADDSSAQKEKQPRSLKKKTESKKQKVVAVSNLSIESTVIERDSPKRSLRRNHHVEAENIECKDTATEDTNSKECKQTAETEEVLKDSTKITPNNEAENEKEVSKISSHRKTRMTRSQTPNREQKIQTPTESVDKTNRPSKSTHKSDKAESLLNDMELSSVEEIKNANNTKTEVIERDETLDVPTEPYKTETGMFNEVMGEDQTKMEEIIVIDKVQKRMEVESEPKEQSILSKQSNELSVKELSSSSTLKEESTNERKLGGQTASLSTLQPKLEAVPDAINSKIDHANIALVSEKVNTPTTSPKKKPMESVVTALDTKEKYSEKSPKSGGLKDSKKIESPELKLISRHNLKSPADDINKLELSKLQADNGKHSPNSSTNRKRRAESVETSPQNPKNKKEDSCESSKLNEDRRHRYISDQREHEMRDKKSMESHQNSPQSPSPKKHLQTKLQNNSGEKTKVTVSSTPSSSSSSTTPAVEITRINVDVANPLSKHPSIVASMLAASSSASASVSQHHSNASKCRSPKHKIISPLKRKLSHEIMGQNVDANNDAVVAHVQSLCPQVKITRKERLIEPSVDAAIPEKLLATPKKSLSPQNKETPPDISQMPIVLSNEGVEATASSGLVSSNLWQTELLQPPNSSEKQQTPTQKRVGFDPRGQKYVMRQPSNEQPATQAALKSLSGNGRLSPQKSTSTSINVGGRKQAGNASSKPVKQQQHKFAEALALADSILAPSVKPTKRRSSQQTVSNSNTVTSNAANSNRRYSSAAAIDTKTANPPAKIPKQMPKEVRSKSNSPTKMQSGNGSGSNSPVTKSRSQTQQLAQKLKQTETSSDEITKTATETTQTTRTGTTASPPTTSTTTLITAAADDAQTVVEAEQLNSAAKITAVPIQPIPGYAETFMLCMFVDDVYKPINDIPHYLNKDLNQLVPVPPEAYEGILPEFVVEQPIAAESEVAAATGLNVSSTTTTTPSGKSTSIVSSRESGETAMEINEETDLRVGLQLDESMLVGNADTAAVDAAAENAIVLKLENQHIILDAASFEQLLANPDASTQLLLEDGTEFVLTREVLMALKAQHDDQAADLLAISVEQNQQQQLQDQLMATEAGSSADLLSVALANSEFYGGEILQIDASDSGFIFRASPLPQAHLTPPITAHTSETNAVLNQTPIMSTLEKPSTTGKAGGIEPSPKVVTAVVDGDIMGARPNLDDSLAVIGVSTQSSTVPSSLELPITITNPAIAPKVKLAGTHGTTTDLVQFQPRRSVATAAVAASSSVANVSHIYDESIDNIN